MVPGTIFLPIGLFLTGWTARSSIHWIVPDIVSPTSCAIPAAAAESSPPQGIAFVGAGTILNFQSIQTYVIDTFTLHAASGKHHAPQSSWCNVTDDGCELMNSVGCGDVPPLVCRLRLPALRADDVQRARLREGRLDPRFRGYRRGLPSVSGVRSSPCCSLTHRVHSPWIFWHYGERIRKASKYARS